MSQRSTLIPNGGELLILGNVTVDPNQLIRGELQVNTGTRLYTTTLIDGDNQMTGTNLIDGTTTIDGENLITGNNRMTGTNQIDGTTTIDGTNIIQGETTVNNQLIITGDGFQQFGAEATPIEEYYGEYSYIDELEGREATFSEDVTIERDLFMNPENKKNFLDLPVAYTIYVKKNGDDSRDGENLSNAVATIRRGLELARAFRRQNPVTGYESDSLKTIMVSVYPGVYVEDGRLEVPEHAGVVSAGGQYITEIHASEDCRNNYRNMFWMNSGSYVQGFTFRNQKVDSFDDPTGGFAVGFAPGANIRRSPYIKDCSQVSNYNPGPAAAPLDPANANPEVGRGGGVVLADKRIVDQNSIFPYILCFGATPRSNNGIGYCARDGGGINGISSLGIFQRICFYALNGGQVTLNNSGTQFGDISMQSTGYVDVVEEKRVGRDVTLVANADAAQAILDASADIIDDMWTYLSTDPAPAADYYPYEPAGHEKGFGYSDWNNSFAYNRDLARRDANTVITAVASDVALGTNFFSLSCGRGFQRQVTSIMRGYGILNQTLSSFDFMQTYITGDDALLTKKPYNGANVTLWNNAEDGDGGRIVYQPEDPVYPNRFDEIDIPASLSLWGVPNGGTGLLDAGDPESDAPLDTNLRQIIRSVKNCFENITEMVSVNKTNDVFFTDDYLPTLKAPYIAAKDIILKNKELIVNRIMNNPQDWVDGNPPSWESFYTEPGQLPEEEFIEERIAFGKRDLIFTLDALMYDMLYTPFVSGNYLGKLITANAYFDLDGNNILPVTERTQVLPQAMRFIHDAITDMYGTQIDPGVLAEIEDWLDTLATEIGGTTQTFPNYNETTTAWPDYADLVGNNRPPEFYLAYNTIINELTATPETLTDKVIDYMDEVFENYYQTLTKRDANTLFLSLAFDLRGASQQVVQTFSLGLFATRAIKVFNDTPVASTEKSIQDAFIWCWDYIQGRLTGVYGPTIDSGASYINDPGLFEPESAESKMIIALLQDVLISTIKDPVIIQFSSLIESLAHQFNNAGAGVNRNALPLNFRYPGFNRPVPFSVIQSKGGRVRWSGSDELNTQYFAGGTRINGITGKFEGRPFNISVRQIARRIANARGFY